MANTFRNGVVAAIGTAPIAVYTAGASKTATIIGLSVANITTGAITVDVTLTDTSAATTVFLIKDAPIPVGSSLIVIGSDQKVVVETTDIIKVNSSAAASIDVALSMLEQDV